MDELTPEERDAFLDIYDADHGDMPTAPAVLDSLIRRGLISRAEDGSIDPTEAGNDLYELMQGDEPYEGI
jgi:hypothetical protein